MHRRGGDPAVGASGAACGARADARARPRGRSHDRRMRLGRPARAAQPPLRANARSAARRDGRARRRARRELGRQGREERRRLRPRQALLRLARHAWRSQPGQPAPAPAARRDRDSRCSRFGRRRGEAAGDPPLDARAERARRDRRAAGRDVRGRRRGGRVPARRSAQARRREAGGDEVWDEVRARPRPQVDERRSGPPRPPRAHQGRARRRRDRPRAHRRLHALRLLPADLPDVRAARPDGGGLAARPHLAHEGAGRRDDDGQLHCRRAHRPLPRLHGVRDRVPVRRPLRPADRADARGR